MLYEITGLRDYEVRAYEGSRSVIANHFPVIAFSHFKLLYLMNEVSNLAMLVSLSSHRIVALLRLYYGLYYGSSIKPDTYIKHLPSHLQIPPNSHQVHLC